MQGDAYSIPITGKGFSLSDVSEVEFTIGTVTKYYRSDGTGEVTADGSGAEPVFAFPITQEESYSLSGDQPFQARVKFAGSGDVIGAREEDICIEESIVRTVL